LGAVAGLARWAALPGTAVTGRGAVGGAALAAVRLRQRRANGTTTVSFPRPVPRRPVQAVPEPRPPAIEAPRPELHLHFHGVTAEDVAAILADVNRNRG